MATLKSKILQLVQAKPGLTDREVADLVLGPASPQQAVNQCARNLAGSGLIVRRQHPNGKIRNFPSDSPVLADTQGLPAQSLSSDMLSEDQVKSSLKAWLEEAGWQVSVAWGRGLGVDIDAKRDGQRWIIEAKGCGSLSPMRVNYFLSILGELLQRMSDPAARYSIALPNIKQYRGLWERLPQLAKSRMQISVLFVDSSGHIEELASGR